MNYYLLRDDPHVSCRWQLGTIEHLDNWRLLKPDPVDMEPGRYHLQMRSPGVPLDYTHTLLYGLPVLSDTARDALLGLPEVDEPYANVVMQPLEIDGGPWRNDYFLMVVETRLDCVDETRSRFTRFEENDPVRPDKAGDYASFSNLVVDPNLIGGRHIFRLSKCETILVVSEEVKRRFEDASVSGCVFASVVGDQEVAA